MLVEEEVYKRGEIVISITLDIIFSARKNENEKKISLVHKCFDSPLHWKHLIEKIHWWTFEEKILGFIKKHAILFRQFFNSFPNGHVPLRPQLFPLVARVFLKKKSWENCQFYFKNSCSKSIKNIFFEKTKDLLALTFLILNCHFKRQEL